MRPAKHRYAKYKTYDEFVHNYMYLKFTFLGIRFTEHIPAGLTPISPLFFFFVRVRMFFEGPITYHLIRPAVVTYTRKAGDIRYITHYKRDGSQTISGFLLYCWLRILYFKELHYVDRCLKRSPSDIPESVNEYMLRWGYMLEVEPEFTALIQGVAPDEATNVLDSLI